VREAADENRGGVRKIPRMWRAHPPHGTSWGTDLEDIVRCAPALYNLGAGVTLHLYDVIRAKSYPVDHNSRHIIQIEHAYALISRAFARAGSIAP
jgi:hypothetical protein